jgi:hypothetical protein
MEMDKKKDKIKKVRLGLLDDLIGQSDKAIAKGAMSVKVSSDSKDGMKKGLEEAKKITDKIPSKDSGHQGPMDEMMSDHMKEGSDEEESSESSDEQSSEVDDAVKELEALPEDELEAKIKELQAKLDEKKNHSPKMGF